MKPFPETAALAKLSPPIGGLIAAVVWWIAPLDTGGSTMLAITAFCVVMWIGNVVPPAYTGCLCIGLLGVAFSVDLALVGFANPATWLIAFGLIMGEATRRSGLARSASGWVIAVSTPDDPVARPRRTYRFLVIGLTTTGFVLVLLVPVAIVRVFILAPILLETGRQFDSARARLGLFFGPLFATLFGSVAILTGGSPNIVLAGIVASLEDVTVTWTDWFLLMFPIMGVARLVLVIGVTLFLYRPEPDVTFSPTSGSPSSLTGAEGRMLVFLLAGIVVWATDAFHGFHPVYGAVLVVLLAFMPRYGAVGFADTVGDVDYSILFFIGAVFAIGEGLSRTGVADQLSAAMLGSVPADTSLFVLLGIVFVATVGLMLIMEGLAVASVITPILVTFATESGVPILPIVLVEAMAIGTVFFPYQSAVLVVILAYEIVEPRELIRMATVSSIATTVLLVPLQLGVFALVW